MFYFILILGLLLSFGKNQKLNSKLYLLVLTFLAVFRYGIGPDYFSYNYLFLRLRDNIVDEALYGIDSQELLFRIIGSFLKGLGFSYQQYLTVFAILTLVYLYKICYKYSCNPTLSLTLYYSFYYFVWVFSGIRQGVVMSIGLYYLLEAIEEGKSRKFLILTFILSFIHTSALVLILFFLISKLQLNRNKLIVYCGFSVAYSILPIGAMITSLASYIPLLNRIAVYSSSGIYVNNIFDFQTIGRLLFLITVILFYDYYVKVYPEQKMILDIYLFSFIIYFLFKFSEMTAARFAIYGRILDILILSNIVYSIKTKLNKYLFLFSLALFMFLYLFKELDAMETNSALINSNPISTPYVNVFNKEEYSYEHRLIKYIPE